MKPPFSTLSPFQLYPQHLPPWHSVADSTYPGLERCTFGASTAFSPTLCSLPRPPTPIGSGQEGTASDLFVGIAYGMTSCTRAYGNIYYIYMYIQIAYNYITYSVCKPTLNQLLLSCRYFIMQVRLMCTDYSNELLAMRGTIGLCPGVAA